jgi:hypothetical protein
LLLQETGTADEGLAAVPSATMSNVVDGDEGDEGGVLLACTML